MKYHIVTLGCPKNGVDSEGMESILTAQGHTHVGQAEDADVLIVNTCSFIAAARDETLEVLAEVGSQKAPGQRLIAAGCMAESHGDLLHTVPGVDAILSTRQWMRIGDMVLLDEPPETAAPVQRATLPAALHPAGWDDWRTASPRRRTWQPSAYLKISDGCNLHCAFCTIPAFKGTMRSKAPDAVLAEAHDLLEQGTRELVLVAQHLTDYGRDLGMHDGLAHLLDELCRALPTDVWVRLVYAYPQSITPRLVETMARHPQICHYLDMPLQHAHPETLRRMHRPPDVEHTRQTIAMLRSAMPDIALRSTFMVGYPGENRAAFRALLAFLEEIQFDHVGAFRFSPEAGTAAAALPDQVNAPVAEKRWHQLMRLQQGISLACNRQWEGRVLEVLVEGEGMTEDGQSLVVGRSFRDAPEVDGQVFAEGQASMGSRIQVQITHADVYDLWGVALTG